MKIDREPMSLIGYDPIGSWERFSKTVEDLLPYRNSAGVTWINLDYLDSDAINTLAAAFHIHPLTVEDILDTNQRPKAEEFDDYLFIVLKAINRDDNRITLEQISIVLMEDTIITFQEKPGDNFDGIRKRIRNNAGRIRRTGSDYLAYALMDAVVDEYYLVLDAQGEEIEEFETRAADDTDAEFIPDIQKVKQSLFLLRKSIWPLRDSVSHIIHSDSKFIKDDLEPFLKDLHDHVLQAAETLENYRDLMAGVIEVNLSAVSNGMNKIMKVLTIISTIFIPLTFIVGVYGMNFAFMPELSSPYGYPVVMGVMIIVAAGMLVFFKRRRWI
ncbi:MAG: magnesium/cobalt transporter CorA [Treponema sp.]|jgi:magnesium transporter|nr:magnesium/cobalt transporter CorA [Treponema sp.]